MDDYYWTGGAYNRHFTDDTPSPDFLELWKNKLDEMLIAPYTITNHLAAVRLASKDRKPIIGSHETHSEIVLFNGFGTKGASLIPYFSEHLIDHMENGTALNELVDIKRYQ
jgi:glycine/D-amino acid oxidase-like deaminating enzyme